MSNPKQFYPFIAWETSGVVQDTIDRKVVTDLSGDFIQEVHERSFHGSNYVKPLLNSNKLHKIARHLVYLIEKQNLEFDAVAVYGNSSTILGSVVAFLLKKDIIVLRKEGAEAH